MRTFIAIALTLLPLSVAAQAMTCRSVPTGFGGWTTDCTQSPFAGQMPLPAMSTDAANMIARGSEAGINAFRQGEQDAMQMRMQQQQMENQRRLIELLERQGR